MKYSFGIIFYTILIIIDTIILFILQSFNPNYGTTNSSDDLGDLACIFMELEKTKEDKVEQISTDHILKKIKKLPFENESYEMKMLKLSYLKKELNDSYDYNSNKFKEFIRERYYVFQQIHTLMFNIIMNG